MITKVLDITPQQAKKWLELNKGNRHLDQRTVRQYASDMKEGKWQLSTDAISFSKDGVLVNGQHRLSAVVLSDVCVQMLVCFDVECDVFDRGRSRTTAQYLSMNAGLSVNGSIVSAARLHFYYKNGENFKPSDAEIRDLLEKNLDLFRMAYILANKKNGGKRLTENAGCVYSFTCALICGISKQQIDRFSEVVNSGFANNQSESAAISFRNYLLCDKMSKKKSGKMAAIETASVCQNCLRKFVSGTPSKLARPSKNLFFSDMI